MPYKDPEKKKQWEKQNRRAGDRHRVWMFVFYEDSACDGWRDEADELGLPFLVSPLHDKDVWTKGDDGLFRNDIVAVTLTDANTVTIDLTEARDVKVVVQSLADLA